MDKEIVKACIKYKNKLFTGFDHGECFENLLKEEQPKDMTELEQGFIDNELNFVDRKNAMEIANNAGQLKFNPVKETLISEDLHLDWLKKQDQKIADLEAKLDEKTRVAEGYSELFDKRQHENYEQFCEIQELKAKLAESEKAFDTICEKYEKKSKQIFETIKCQEECSNAYGLLSKENEQLKQQIIEEKNRNKKLNHEAQKYYEDAYCNGFQNKKAIAELEGLKNYLPNIALDIPDMVSYRCLKKQIDRQIAELKGEADE